MNNIINAEYSAEKNARTNMTQDTALLWQYQKLIMGCSHFNDLTALDARAFSITLNVEDGKQVELRKIAYFSVLRAFCGNTYVIGPHRPAFIIEDDIGGTKWGKGRDENHHFHALLVLPHIMHPDAMIEQDIEHKLVCLLEEIRGVSDAYVERYYIGDSLAGVMKYNAKLVDRPALDPSDGLKAIGSGIYPWEFDQSATRATKSAKERRLREVAKLLVCFKSDASAFFTSEYIHHFGDEIAQVTQHFSLAWAVQYPDLWNDVTHARKRLKSGLRLTKFDSVDSEAFRAAA